MGKSDSYEDAFDIMNPPAVKNKSKNDLDSRIEKYYERKRKQKKKVKRAVAKKDNNSSYITKNIKKSVYPKKVKNMAIVD